MATSKNAKVQYEAGRTLTTYAVMSDGGDHKIHYIAAGPVWSGRSGYEPVVRPNGIVTGRNVLTPSATADAVSIAAFTAYSKGTLNTVTATHTDLTRSSTATKAQIHSITMASDGSIAVVVGTISASTAFSETRGAAGGPPLIPINSVEIGQVRITSSTAAVFTTSEIYQVVGTHTERYDYPGWEEYNVGRGNDKATGAFDINAFIEFDSALPLDHTGPVAKKTYIQYYAPTFSNLAKAMDFKPAEKTHSISTEEYYGKGDGYAGVVGSTTSSLGQGGFTAMMADNLTDGLVTERDQVCTIKFYPDADKTPYILTQGTLGVARTFPIGSQNKATCTISAEKESASFTG